MSAIQFKIEKKIKNKLGRAGMIATSHGTIQTPAFVIVGTKATVKSLTPEEVSSLGGQVVLANTYHLYLEPGDGIIKKAGGINRFMNWPGPIMTDSGGFQAFSLGAAYGNSVSKIAKNSDAKEKKDSCREDESVEKFAKITEEGVLFKSVIDGSKHFFSPEKSIQIQHAIGADIIFAFDECTSPLAPHEYQKEALERTHRWGERSLSCHQSLEKTRDNNTLAQAIFGIVQGGRFEDLRRESARVIGKMEFDGFGIGGSFEKADIDMALGWVNEILPEGKPRHLLGIGDPLDLLGAVEAGADLFDCVAPTRMARNGTLYTKGGKINILNSRYRSDFSKIDNECGCYTCAQYTRSYLAHLFRSKEILANTLASIHNLYFIVHLVKKMREAILDDNFLNFKENFTKRYAVSNPACKAGPREKKRPIKRDPM